MRKLVITIIFFVFWFYFPSAGSAATVPCVGNCPSLSPGTGTGDWPMAAANLQRTSWNSEEVRGSLNIGWYRPIEPYIPYKIQPIAANGRIYVSTARGLYAFNATNGNLDWVYPTKLPLGHSPTFAVINGVGILYVPGLDHKIHALDAANGQSITGYTPYEAKAGFEVNPLVAKDSYTNNIPLVLAGNRDGKFYALNGLTGALVWSFTTDGPISFSAAYKNGIVYFASQDMYGYALNVASGSLIWKSDKLAGSGFFSFWPVIYTNRSTGKDYVVFTGSENYRGTELFLQTSEDPLGETYIFNNSYGLNLPNGNLPVTNPPVSGDWVSGTVTMNAEIINDYLAKRDYLAERPYRHYVFILDANNGLEFSYTNPMDNTLKTYAPFVWSGITSSGSKYPPLINGVDGVYYQQTPYVDFDAWASRGAPVGWKFGTQYISKVAQGNNPETYASDEPTVYSSGGKIIYTVLCCDRAAEGFDITIPYGQPNRAWAYWGYNMADNSLAPGYQAMYDDGNSVLFNDGNGWQVYSGKNKSKNGIYGKHGTTQSPLIPYQGKLFTLKGNALLSFGPGSVRTALPLATVVDAQDSVTPPTISELKQRLETEVQKMISAGHLRPGYFPAGFYDIYGTGSYGGESEFGEIFDYFQNPADTVVTLLQAYPYLSTTTQQQVKSYLQNNYGPGKTYDFTKIVHIGWRNGAVREWSDTPSDWLNSSRSPGNPYRSPLDPSTVPTCAGGDGRVCGYWYHFPPFNFYAAWKYAQIVGNNDQAFAKNIFNLMSGKIEAPPSGSVYPITKKPYLINLYAAGYLGYLNLKQLAGLGGDATVQNYYNQMLSLRINNFSKDNPYWNDSTQFNEAGINYNRALSVARNFMFLTPEIADYMSQNIKSAVQSALDEYNYVGPYWFINKFDNEFGEGTTQHLYDQPSNFQARAYILKEPLSELAKYLDVPSFKVGDLFYIQNLVAALQAASSGPTPTPTPDLCPKSWQGDVNCDQFINIADLRLILTNLGGNGLSYDINKDSRVNIFDVGLILANFGK